MVKISKTPFTEQISDIKRRLTTYKWEDGVRKINKEFFVETPTDIYLYNDELVKYEMGATKFKIIKPFMNGAKANFKNIGPFKPYDYQEQVIVPVFKEAVKNKVSRFLFDMPTGTGKTFTSCELFNRIDKRFTILLPRYIEKWIKDIQQFIELKDTDNDLFVIQGKDSLIKLMKMDTSEVPRIVIISTRTMTSAITHMINGTYDEIYPMKLEDLIKHIKHDQILIDEAHQEFHAIYNILTVLNPKLTIGLSATFDTPDQSQEKFLTDVFPKEKRLNTVKQEKYRKVTSIEYRVGFTKNITVKSYFTKAYSHVTYESSILRNKLLKQRYFDMILYALETYHIQTDNVDGRCLIFLETIKMIEEFIDFLREIYPNKSILKYTGKDPLNNILTADISCSTLGSASTAIDVPNLKTVINTVSVKSIIRNTQAFGRLREIENCTPNYVYLWSPDIGSQASHHQLRIKYHKKEAKVWELTEYPIDINPAW